ncbi:MAG: alpha/beta hydrolase family protein [Thermoplasmatota archaeon]
MNIQNIDPVVQDPTETDTDHPCSLEHVLISVEDDPMFGVLYKPMGKGPHPTVILLHGFPGHERNFDIAHCLRRSGFNVLIFHYRGAWGSHGDFSFSNMLKDTEASLGFLRNNSMALGVDKDRILLIGHSMGGWAAMMIGSQDEEVRMVGSLAGFNLGITKIWIMESMLNRSFIEASFQRLSEPFKGCTPEGLVEEVIENGEEWDLLSKGRVLSGKNLLMVGAKRDDVAWPAYHFDALVSTLRDHQSSSLAALMLDTDHNFSDKRIALSRTILGWCSGIQL